MNSGESSVPIISSNDRCALVWPTSPFAVPFKASSSQVRAFTLRNSDEHDCFRRNTQRSFLRPRTHVVHSRLAPHPSHSRTSRTRAPHTRASHTCASRIRALRPRASHTRVLRIRALRIYVPRATNCHHGCRLRHVHGYPFSGSVSAHSDCFSIYMGSDKSPDFLRCVRCFLVSSAAVFKALTCTPLPRSKCANI